jgi:acetolactate synthase I/II/III large subunit
MRVADWVVDRLAEEGIRHIFMLPGGGAMYLNDALACTSRIQTVVCQHEQACGIAAEAYGRTGYKENPGFGVAMVTTGPGATNVVTPIAGAWIDSIPLLIISGQAKRPDRINGRLIRQGGVQEVEIVPMVKAITKYAVTIEDPERIQWHFEKALSLMTSGRPGPVLLDVPLDVQAAQIDPMKILSWTAPQERILSTQLNLAPVISLLQASKRPLILAGHGVRLSGAADIFLQLVEKFRIPTVLTWNALDLLSHEHPLNIGRPGVVAARAPNFAVQNCDLLISIGARLDNIVTAYNSKGFARGARKIVVDVDLNELDDKTTMGIDLPIVADAIDFIKELNSASVDFKTNDNWIHRCADWKARFTQNEGKVFPEVGPISHAHFVEALSESVPEDVLVATGSSGLAVEFFYAGFRNKPGQRTFLTSGLGAMGYGLPSAIGACFGNAKKPMLAIESDGSLQLNLQEFSTLVHHNLPICLFVMNNNGYASIRNTQRTHFEERYLSSGPESGLEMPNLEKIADTFGLAFKQIDDCAGLDEALVAAQHLPRPCIVDVRLIPNETLQPKCATILKDDGTIISMPLEDMSPLLSIESLESEMVIDVLEESRQARDI